MVTMHGLQRPMESDLSPLFPEADWSVFQQVFERAEARHFRYAVGGGLAFSAYAGRFRNTKDVDVYVQPADREAMIEAITESGFVDYFDRAPYDRGWIYRGYREGLIFDVIWQMANRRSVVDDAWVSSPHGIRLHGWHLGLIPPEELLWAKLYVLQRDRCDWPDTLNLLYSQGVTLNWPRLLERLGDDAKLLAAALLVLSWMCPDKVREFPEWIWNRLRLPAPHGTGDCLRHGQRVAFLDTRDWFGPNGVP